MDFTLGFIAGGFMMWITAKRLNTKLKRDIEKLKDFEIWKKWKDEKTNTK